MKQTEQINSDTQDSSTYTPNLKQFELLSEDVAVLNPCMEYWRLYMYIDLVQVTKIHFFHWCREYELLKIGSW